MGRSAKHLKRVKKSKSTTTSHTHAPVAADLKSSPAAQGAKKRTNGPGLKAKARSKSTTGKAELLGGADYVTLALGGRRKAQQEAVKLARASEDAPTSVLSPRSHITAESAR